MRLLLVTATDLEVQPIASALRHVSNPGPRLRTYAAGAHEVDVLTTGVGMVATAAWCARVLATTRYDLALDVGLCGSFDPALEPGHVVHVVTDRIPELGAEDGDRFLTVHELQLLGEDEFPFRGGRLTNEAPPSLAALAALPAVHGISVSTVHGHVATIAAVVERFHPQVESMEGAGFMYACLTHGIRFAQVRAVSNRVEPRNRAAWKIADAIGNLAGVTLRMIEQV